MECSAKSDEWLMSDVVDGCSESLEPLVRRYANPLLTFIRRMVNHPQQSEELFQDVFLAVWKGLPRFRGEAELGTWLTRITINKCRSHQRKQMLRLRRLWNTEGGKTVDSAPADRATLDQETELASEVVARGVGHRLRQPERVEPHVAAGPVGFQPGNHSRSRRQTSHRGR